MTSPLPKEERTWRVRFAPGRLLLLASAGLVGWLVIANAWVAEDAYITFRSVEQLHAGFGPRWNPHERVQAFTHPLWFLALAAGRLVSPDLFAVALALSLACVAAVAIIVARSAATPVLGAAAILALGASRAAIDYATSGLENALAGLLVAALFTTAFTAAPGSARFRALTTVVGLLLCTRHDLGVLAGPLWLFAAWQAWTSRGIRRLVTDSLIGFAPFLAWTMFSVAYYGFPFPNTAYAKLNTGIASHDLVTQGREYLWDFMSRDPAGALIIAAAVAMSYRRLAAAWAGAGIVAYGLYVMVVGGDFMSGRFFMVPVVGAVCVLAHVVTRPWIAVAAAGALTLTTATMPSAPVRVAMSGVVVQEPWRAGIADEKAFYFAASSLRAWWGHRADRPFPDHENTHKGIALQSWDDRVTVAINIGLSGYFAPLDMRIIDVLALTDPLLARRPAGRPSRVGHYWRLPPEGYIDSVRRDGNHLTDPRLRPYFDDIRLATQAPIFDASRWRAIVRLNLQGPPPWTDADVPRLQDVPPEWIARPELMARPR